MAQFIGDAVSFNFNVNPADWPTLSCSQPNVLALNNSDLQLDAARSLRFQSNGQLSFQSDGQITAQSILSLHTGVAPTERLRITADGNVGIGKTPGAGYKLDVAGTLKVTGNAEIDGTLTVSKINNRDVVADGNQLDTHVANMNNPHGVTAQQVGALTLDGGTLLGALILNDTFHVVGNGTFDQDLAVSGHTTLTGNVGIGTTIPRGLLDVKGLLTVTNDGSVYIGGGPDYVTPNIQPKLQVYGDFRILGEQNLIKVITIPKTVQNMGVDKPANWSVMYTGFQKVYAVFAVLQGFSLWPNADNIAFNTWGHAADAGAIPQHVFVRVDKYDTSTASGVAYCSEARPEWGDNNSVLFTVVVMGMGS